MFGMSAFNRKARQFTHIPIFYDPEKEAREQRDAHARGEKDKNYTPGRYLHTQRRNRILGIDRIKPTINVKRVMLTRLLIAMCLLIVIAYMIVNSDILVKIIQLQ